MDWLKDKVFAAEAFGQMEEHLSDGSRLLANVVHNCKNRQRVHSLGC
jgi:hypothetical protein